MPDKGQAGEILQRMAADSSEACGEMHGKPKTSESDLFGYRQTQMGHLRFLLGESSSIRKMIFRFQLPLYLENSSWAWVKKIDLTQQRDAIKYLSICLGLF